MNQFLAMGGYAFYVWTSYAVFADLMERRRSEAEAVRPLVRAPLRAVPQPASDALPAPTSPPEQVAPPIAGPEQIHPAAAGPTLTFLAPYANYARGVDTEMSRPQLAYYLLTHMDEVRYATTSQVQDVGEVHYYNERKDRLMNALLAFDPRGTMLAAPTNVAFGPSGEGGLYVANLGRWHICRAQIGVHGQPLAGEQGEL